MKKYYQTFKDMQIYTNYQIGVKNAFEQIEGMEEKIEEFQKKNHDFDYYTKMFSIDEGTVGAKKILQKIEAETKAIRTLWEHIKLVQNTFEKYLQMEWKDVHATEMED
jgi:hypothetical protein